MVAAFKPQKTHIVGESVWPILEASVQLQYGRLAGHLILRPDMGGIQLSFWCEYAAQIAKIGA